MKLIDSFKENILMIVLFLLIGGSGLYFLVLHPKLRVSTVPKFVKAYVVVKAKSQSYATNEPLILKTDDEPMLYAVIAAKKQGEDNLTWFTEADSLKIDGKIIDSHNIEKWDTFKWKDVRIMWFKIEPVIYSKFRTEAFNSQNIKYKLDFQHTWPFEWSHKLDVNGFADTYPRQNLGTMRFKIRAEIKTSSVEFVEKVISPGEDDVDENNIISDNVFKVTVIPEESLFGYMMSMVNLAYCDSIDYTKLNTIEKGIAVDTTGYYTNAAKMAGFKDINLGDIKSFKNHFSPIYTKVHLDKEKGVYVDEKGERFKIENLKKGYVFIKNDLIGIFAGEGSMEIGKMNFLSPDDRVLMSRELPLYYEKVGEFFENDFKIGILK